MTILSCSNVKKAYGIDTILEQVSFHVDENDKIGLIGVNGAGKTTLFKLIVGEIQCDEGEIYKAKDLKIGYMAQNHPFESEKSVWDELLGVFSHLIQMEKEIKSLERQIHMAKDPKLLESLVLEHANLCEKFKEQNGYGFESHIRAVLIGLGFSDDQFWIPIKNLSGGQKTRVALAKLLLQKPQLLLLDEPTNHLDIKAVEWLEEFLSLYSGSIMIISHDRYFLDKVTNRTIEIENKKAYTYEGSYSTYIRKKTELRQQQLKQYTLQQKEISRIEAIIKQQKQWNRERNIRIAESRQKALDRMVKVEAPENLPESIRFEFQPILESGNDVLTVENLSKAFGQNVLFENLNFKIKKRERVFLLGDNGTGKTTLFKIILKHSTSDRGSIKWGTNVVVGYYDQEQANLDENKTIIDEIWDAYPKMTQTEIRNALAAFLFKGDDVFKKISDLSGGEKGRVALIKIMLSGANFLILDEPTNHLDISSREKLEEALLDYEGTLFVISHDRYFINKIATKIFHLTSKGIEEFIGNYDYFNEKIKKKLENRKFQGNLSNQEQISEQKMSKQVYEKQKEEKARERKQQKLIAKLEENIEITENTIRDLELQLCEPEIYTDHEKSLEIMNEINELKAKLEKYYEEWGALQDN